jgi:hypothetical protein
MNIDIVSFIIGIAVGELAALLGTVLAHLAIRRRRKAIARTTEMCLWLDHTAPNALALTHLTRKALDCVDARDWAGAEAAYLSARQLVKGSPT